MRAPYVPSHQIELQQLDELCGYKIPRWLPLKQFSPSKD